MSSACAFVCVVRRGSEAERSCSMPTIRAKKKKAANVGAAELAEDTTNAPADEGVDQAHNLQQYCCSVMVLATAVTSWPWHRTSKAAVRQFLSSHDSSVPLDFSKLRASLKNVQCNTCANELEAALASALMCKELLITRHVALTVGDNGSSLTLKGITADTLAQLVRMAETAAGGDKGGCLKTPAELIAAAQQTAAADDKVVFDIADISGEVLAVCAKRPGALLQPDDSTEPRLDQNLLMMLENLTQRRERADELCKVVDTTISFEESDDASANAGDIDWNPKFAHKLQSADHAIGVWLRQLTMLLVAVGSLQSMAFLTGSSDRVEEAAVLADGLWSCYDSCLGRLLAIVLESREEQMRLAPQPAMMALFLARNLRQAIAKALALKFSELTRLHKYVLHTLNSMSTRYLLQKIERLRCKWEQPLLADQCSELDDFAKRLLVLRLQLFSGEHGSSLVGPTDLVAMQAQQDSQLITTITAWEATLDGCKDDMLRRASKDMSPAQYPQTAAYTQCLKDWHAEYEAEWDNIEQKKHLQTFRPICSSSIKLAEAQLGKEQQLLVKQQQQQRSSVSETATTAAAAAAATADSGSVGSEIAADAAAGRSTADSTDSNSEQSAAIKAFEARIQELFAQKNKVNQQEVGGKLRYRHFMVSQLMRRYWRTREFCARLRAHVAVKSRQADKLCGGSAAAGSRLRVILACCTLDAVSAAMTEWLAQQTEQQLLQEADTLSGGQKQQQQQRKSKKGKGGKGLEVTATSETVTGETVTSVTTRSETAAAVNTAAGDADASSSSSDAAVVSVPADISIGVYAAVAHSSTESTVQQQQQLADCAAAVLALGTGTTTAEEHDDSSSTSVDTAALADSKSVCNSGSSAYAVGGRHQQQQQQQKQQQQQQQRQQQTDATAVQAATTADVAAAAETPSSDIESDCSGDTCSQQSGDSDTALLADTLLTPRSPQRQVYDSDDTESDVDESMPPLMLYESTYNQLTTAAAAAAASVAPPITAEASSLAATAAA
eukprot:3450-Heterococcus_DN1.PRE.2